MINLPPTFFYDLASECTILKIGDRLYQFAGTSSARKKNFLVYNKCIFSAEESADIKTLERLYLHTYAAEITSWKREFVLGILNKINSLSEAERLSAQKLLDTDPALEFILKKLYLTAKLSKERRDKKLGDKLGGAEKSSEVKPVSPAQAVQNVNKLAVLEQIKQLLPTESYVSDAITELNRPKSKLNEILSCGSLLNNVLKDAFIFLGHKYDLIESSILQIGKPAINLNNKNYNLQRAQEDIHSIEEKYKKDLEKFFAIEALHENSDSLYDLLVKKENANPFEDVKNKTDHFWNELNIGFLKGGRPPRYYVYQKIPAFVLRDGARYVKIDDLRIAVPLVLYKKEVKPEIRDWTNNNVPNYRCQILIEARDHPFIPNPATGFDTICMGNNYVPDQNGTIEEIVLKLLGDAENTLKYGYIRGVTPYSPLGDARFNKHLITKGEAKKYEVIPSDE